jgi:hypothetical protein
MFNDYSLSKAEDDDSASLSSIYLVAMDVLMGEM